MQEVRDRSRGPLEGLKRTGFNTIPRKFWQLICQMIQNGEI